MSEPEKSEGIDPLLRRSLAVKPIPTLSPEFERRLASRLSPKSRSLSPRSRYVLWGYSVLGIVLSLWAMVASGIDGKVACAAVVLPLIIVVPVARPYFWPRAIKPPGRPPSK